MRDYQFGNFLRDLRLAKGLSQAELGERVGVSNKAVSKWENGASKPTMDTLRRLADFLEVTPEELLAGRRRAPTESADDFARVLAARTEISTPMTAYFKWSLVILCGAVLAVFPVMLFLEPWWLKTLAYVLILLAARFAVSVAADRCIHRILYEEMDPVKYAGAVFTLQPPLSVHLTAAIFAGDYARAVNIGHAQLERAKSPVHERNCLIPLARVYFLCGDREGLTRACDRFDATLPADPAAAYTARRSWPIFDFYRAFLDGDYEAALALCATARQKIDRAPRAKMAKLAALGNEFGRAVILYHMGETEAASAAFADIAETAPKLHMATLSRQYMDGTFCPVVLMPEDGYAVYDAEILRAAKKKRVSRWVIAGFCLLLLAVEPVAAGIASWQQENAYREEIAAYEKNLHDALSEVYDTYELLDYFNVERNGAVVDVFAIVETEQGVDVVSFRRMEGRRYVTVIAAGLTDEDNVKAVCLLDGSTGVVALYASASDIPTLQSGLCRPIIRDGETWQFCLRLTP